MAISEQVKHEWEQLFSQFKTPNGETVICMVHKATKKSVYFDSELNRLLSKKEAKLYSLDKTGLYSIITEAQK